MHDDNDEWWCCLGWGWGRSKTSHKNKNEPFLIIEPFSNFAWNFGAGRRYPTTNTSWGQKIHVSFWLGMVGSGWKDWTKKHKIKKWGQHMFKDSNKKNSVTAFSKLIRWKRFNQRIQELSILNFYWNGMFGRGRSKTFNQKKKRSNQWNFQFWLDWDVWEEPAEKDHIKINSMAIGIIVFKVDSVENMHQLIQFWLECWSRRKTFINYYDTSGICFMLILEWLDPVAKIEPKKQNGTNGVKPFSTN